MRLISRAAKVARAPPKEWPVITRVALGFEAIRLRTAEITVEETEE